ELLEVLLDQLRQLPQQLAAPRARHPGPRPVVERASGGLDGAVDIFAIGFGDMRHHGTGRGVIHGEGLARRSGNPLIVDEELALARQEPGCLFAESAVYRQCWHTASSAHPVEEAMASRNCGVVLVCSTIVAASDQVVGASLGFSRVPQAAGMCLSM